MTDPRPDLFDRALWRQRRDRAVRSAAPADFLWREVAEGLAERLSDVTRQFPDAAIVGAAGGAVADALTGRFGIARLTQVESAAAMLDYAGRPDIEGVEGDEEALPLAEAAKDLILSPLTLHAANDPVGALIQMRRALRPDGLMIAALFGGDSLRELRVALAEAEVALEGGLSPRVAPMGEIRALGALLQRAGFAMPVADADRHTVTYADPLALMRDLRAMGETNVMNARRKTPLRRATLLKACEIYQSAFGMPDGRIPATVEIVYLSGWAPAAGQPQPKRPGSATARLADALGATEASAGEKAGE